MLLCCARAARPLTPVHTALSFGTSPHPSRAPIHPPPARVPDAIWGMAYILLFSWLLPGHDGVGETNLTSELLVEDK